MIGCATAQKPGGDHHRRGLRDGARQIRRSWVLGRCGAGVSDTTPTVVACSTWNTGIELITLAVSPRPGRQGAAMIILRAHERKAISCWDGTAGPRGQTPPA